MAKRGTSTRTASRTRRERRDTELDAISGAPRSRTMRATKREPPQAQARKPTYGAAARLAKIVLGLASRPFGWSFDAIRAQLGISERTLLRYIAVCRRELVNSEGGSAIEVVQHGERRLLRLTNRARTAESTAFEAASLYFTFTMLRFLEGTVVRDLVDGLWDKVLQGVPLAQRFRVADLDRKFHSVAYAPKDYREHDAHLDTIFGALLHNFRLHIDYAGLAGEGHQHNFDPYTLLAYRGGLYLLGKSDVYNRVIYLAVERIRSVAQVTGANGQPERFVYPRNYRPENYLNGVFGLIEGPETRVELLLRGESEALLRSRVVHPSQQFRRRADGSTVLTMTVKGTTELRNWILSMGPWIEVLKPDELRAEVADLLREASSLYRPPNRRRAPAA